MLIISKKKSVQLPGYLYYYKTDYINYYISKLESVLLYLFNKIIKEKYIIYESSEPIPKPELMLGKIEKILLPKTRTKYTLPKYPLKIAPDVTLFFITTIKKLNQMFHDPQHTLDIKIKVMTSFGELFLDFKFQDEFSVKEFITNLKYLLNNIQKFRNIFDELILIKFNKLPLSWIFKINLNVDCTKFIHDQPSQKYQKLWARIYSIAKHKKIKHIVFPIAKKINLKVAYRYLWNNRHADINFKSDVLIQELTCYKNNLLFKAISIQILCEVFLSDENLLENKIKSLIIKNLLTK